jgi:type III secretion protein J
MRLWAGLASALLVSCQPTLRDDARPQAPTAQAKPSGFEFLRNEPGFLVTPREERARWAAAMSVELARSLEQLPGVTDARVHLAVSSVPVALDQPQPPAKASVLLRRAYGASPVAEGHVQALVAGAVEGLAPDHVAVVQASVRAPSPAAPALVRLGPIEVTRRSSAALRAVLGSALALDLVLALALIAVVYRRRSRTAR